MSATELALRAVAEARSAGADAADAFLVEDDGVSVLVRDGRTERVERSMSRGIGVRAFRGTRLGIAYTNDVSDAAVRGAAHRASELAAVAAEDPAAGLPDAAELGALDAGLDMTDPSHASWNADTWNARAGRAEAAAREDARITLSEGSRAGGGRRVVTLANSHGFAASRSRTYAVVTASVFAQGAGGERQRDAWYTDATHADDLESPESVGREAARRAIRRCGYRKPPSGPFPVVFPPEVARDVLRSVAQAVSASLVFRRGSFLADRMGEVVASPLLRLVDDPTLARRSGSREFDGEGVRARRTSLFDEGRLVSWLADSYSARRLGTTTTGHASRGITGSPGVAPSNLVLAPGTGSAEDLVADVPAGLYVTDLLGMGVNLASGAWSRGAAGIWIENGRLAHPVQELTVAGDLPGMLRGLTAVAGDLTWHGSTAAPTVRIDGLTVAAG